MTPATARAGGQEYAGAGARGLARAGAVAAKPEDAMTLLYNPAGLAELRGTQLMAGFNVPFFHACVQPIGYYGWGHNNVTNWGELPDPETGISDAANPTLLDPKDVGFFTDPMDHVCLEQHLQPIPQLALTFRVGNRLGVGLGLIYPAAAPTGNWGGRFGVIRSDDGALRPSPVRYMQISSATMAFFPTLGFGWRLADVLRIGAAFQWGIVRAHTETMSRITAGTHPQRDQLVEVSAVDYFLPVAIASVQLVPTDALDVVLAARIQDSFDVPGTMNLFTGAFDPAFVTHKNRFQLDRVHQRLPWTTTLAVRYADRLRPRSEGDGDTDIERQDLRDAMSDERWDIELDLVYEMNSRNDRQEVTGANTCRPDPSDPTGVAQLGCQEIFAIAEQTGARVLQAKYPTSPQYVEKRWQDQLSARLGASYNVLPSRLSFSAGAHYEPRGIEASHMQVDFWPLARVGLHCGATLRVGAQVDVSLAYAHIFQETLVVAPPAPQHTPTASFDKTVDPEACALRTPACTELADPRAPTRAHATAAQQQNLVNTGEGAAYVINAGTYTSSFDIVAVGLVAHY